jgi:hypothetical protein
VKRRLLLAPAAAAIVSLLASETTAQSAPHPTKWQQYQQSLYKRSAPADEYFGRQKYSYLGINNALRVATVLSGDHTTDPGIISTLSRIDDALTAWTRKYPNDPQLARTYFLVVRADTKVWTQPYQEKAWAYLHLLLERFPTSYFARQVRRDLAVGFTEHYYAEPQICPSPSPSPTVTPTETPAPKHGRKDTPEPTASPTASPTQEPTESPAPQPTPLPGPNRPKVEILTPPCVPMLTPSPTPYVPQLPSTTAVPSAPIPSAYITSAPVTVPPSAPPTGTAATPGIPH